MKLSIMPYKFQSNKTHLDKVKRHTHKSIPGSIPNKMVKSILKPLAPSHLISANISEPKGHSRKIVLITPLKKTHYAEI